jgi:Putative addiction module component
MSNRTKDFTMNMAELSTLPLAQRLEAMEVLWDSLSHDSAYEPSPAWHADVLAQRAREIEAGQATDWADAKARILTQAAQFNSQRHA